MKTRNTDDKKSSGLEDNFFAQVNEVLDQSCDSIDGYTQSRLTTIRHQALGKIQTKTKSKFWIPASAVGLTCCLLLFVNLGWQYGAAPSLNSDGSLVNDSALEDLDLLTAEEGLEFFEDLEFYQWLAENDLSV